MARRDLSGAVEFSRLEDFTLNDAVVIEEVLNLFQQQAQLWAPLLDASHEGWRDAAHTIKGAASGIGAMKLSELAHAAEHGDAEGAATRLERLKTGLDEALMDVSAYLHELQLKSLKG